MQAFRIFYLALGWLCVALGIVGIILPLLPTTPFLLVAVWAFSKSSPALAAKLRNHPKAGPYIRAWQDHGAIPVVGKVLSTVMMAAMGIYLVGFSLAPLWAAISVCIAMAAVAGYILTRPSAAP
jgi:uncharacterized protein